MDNSKAIAYLLRYRWTQKWKALEGGRDQNQRERGKKSNITEMGNNYKESKLCFTIENLRLHREGIANNIHTDHCTPPH